MAEMSQASEASSQANDLNQTVYEVGFHVVPTVAEAEVGGVVEKIRSVLEKANAEIIKEEFPAKRTLAYVVERAMHGKREKYSESYFGFIKFAAEKSTIADVTAAIRGMNEILRFLVVQTVREDVGPSRRAVFSSDRLEGETIKKPIAAPEAGEVSDEELNKSIDALVN